MRWYSFEIEKRSKYQIGAESPNQRIAIIARWTFPFYAITSAVVARRAKDSWDRISLWQACYVDVKLSPPSDSANVPSISNTDRQWDTKSVSDPRKESARSNFRHGPELKSFRIWRDVWKLRKKGCGWDDRNIVLIVALWVTFVDIFIRLGIQKSLCWPTSTRKSVVFARLPEELCKESGGKISGQSERQIPSSTKSCS